MQEISHHIGQQQAYIMQLGIADVIKIIMRKVVQDCKGTICKRMLKNLFGLGFCGFNRKLGCICRLADIQKPKTNVISYVKENMKNQFLYLLVIPALFAMQCSKKMTTHTEATKTTTMNTNDSNAVVKTEEEWKKILSPEEYRILREKGTERAFSSEYETLWDSGTYVCKACGAELFTSATKFDAGCGWPSFYQGINKSAVKEIVDNTHGMSRTEVVCARCNGHLGHVFTDGYGQPTGLRYCINGVSLGFKKK